MATQVQRRSRLINAVPFFYGWVILAVGTWGSVMMGPSQTFTFGLFIDSFERELQLSRATLSLLYGMATLGAAFLLPLVGKAIDRYGARRMMLAVTLGFGLSCLAMGSAQGLVTLLLALLALRFLGFGAMHLTSTTLITQWFIRKRGFVMGLAGQSLAISLFIYPPLGEFLIDQFTWRGAWMAFGVLVWVIMLPLGWLFYRDKPEIYGLHPDGDSPTAHGIVSTQQRGEQDNEVNWTLPEARQTRACWIFAAALSAGGTDVAAGFYTLAGSGHARDLAGHSLRHLYGVVQWQFPGHRCCVVGQILWSPTPGVDPRRDHPRRYRRHSVRRISARS